MVRRTGPGEIAALIIVIAAMALIGFWPMHVDRPVAPTLNAVLVILHRLGVPPWFDYHTIQFTANIVLFMPLGALVASKFPRALWWSSVVVGTSPSLMIEFVQAEFLNGRTADPSDVFSNSVGSLLGGAVTLCSTQVPREHRKSTCEK